MGRRGGRVRQATPTVEGEKRYTGDANSGGGDKAVRRLKGGGEGQAGDSNSGGGDEAAR